MENVTLHQHLDSSFDGGYLKYQLQQTDKTVWIARAYREDYIQAEWLQYFFPWATNTFDWLRSRAATLLCLESLRYPAPRVLHTRYKAPIGEAEGWCILLIGTHLYPFFELHKSRRNLSLA